MIDAELVTRKALLIARDLKSLATLAQKSRTEFLAAPFDETLAERYLERVIGRMIDVNFHLITEAGLPPPRDYFQSFTQLAQLGVSSPEFARRIAASAGLRNRLVHEYDEIDADRIYDAVRTAVTDVPQYLRDVDDYVRRSPEP